MTPSPIFRCAAAALAVVLEAGALCAPFAHAHVDDHHDDHGHTTVIHAHFTHHETFRASESTPRAIGGDGEQPISIEWYLTEGPASGPHVGFPAATFAATPPLQSAAARPPAVSHGHDPPSHTPLHPRAPPA